ncbi:MAG: hypothetical protein AAB907_03880 [Patescibacteria group bacterium]
MADSDDSIREARIQEKLNRLREIAQKDEEVGEALSGQLDDLVEKLKDPARRGEVEEKLRRLMESEERGNKVAELVGQYINYVNSGNADVESAQAQWKQIDLLLQQQDRETFVELSEELAFSEALLKLGKWTREKQAPEG